MDHNGQETKRTPMRPVVFAVARVHTGGRFTYLTPHWPDAHGYLVGLLEGHAAATAVPEVARSARVAARQVPAVLPAGAWSAQVGECRYQLARVEVCPAADAAEQVGA